MSLTLHSLGSLAGFAKAASASNSSDARRQAEEEVVALFEQFRDSLLRYLSSFGLDVPDSEEVLQEVFLSLFKHLQGGKPRDSLRGWLFRVAHNLALKRRHRLRRDRDLQGAAEAGDRAVDPAPSPEEQLATSQTQRRLHAAIRTLPELDRHCIVLRAEGLRYREIADTLGMSLGAVSNSLARSLARMACVAKQ